MDDPILMETTVDFDHKESSFEHVITTAFDLIAPMVEKGQVEGWHHMVHSGVDVRLRFESVESMEAVVECIQETLTNGFIDAGLSCSELKRFKWDVGTMNKAILIMMEHMTTFVEIAAGIGCLFEGRFRSKLIHYFWNQLDVTNVNEAREKLDNGLFHLCVGLCNNQMTSNGFRHVCSHYAKVLKRLGNASRKYDPEAGSTWYDRIRVFKDVCGDVWGKWRIP